MKTGFIYIFFSFYCFMYFCRLSVSILPDRWIVAAAKRLLCVADKSAIGHLGRKTRFEKKFSFERKKERGG
jgi:hypothetical protein